MKIRLTTFHRRQIKENFSLPPTLDEVGSMVRKVKNNKVTGVDRIPAKIFKGGREQLTCQLQVLILTIWNKEEIPADLRNALIVVIFKKGDRADCGNYQGIFVGHCWESYCLYPH